MKITWNNLINSLESEHKIKFKNNLKTARSYSDKNFDQWKNHIITLVERRKYNIIGGFIDYSLHWADTNEGYEYWSELKAYYKNVPLKKNKIWV